MTADTADPAGPRISVRDRVAVAMWRRPRTRGGAGGLVLGLALGALLPLTVYDPGARLYMPVHVPWLGTCVSAVTSAMGGAAGTVGGFGVGGRALATEKSGVLGSRLDPRMMGAARTALRKGVLPRDAEAARIAAAIARLRQRRPVHPGAESLLFGTQAVLQAVLLIQAAGSSPARAILCGAGATAFAVLAADAPRRSRARARRERVLFLSGGDDAPPGKDGSGRESVPRSGR
ncbi:hypothetical protein [Streptomonospora wellingtoniae]|uniref:Uncharacterized protein n=1 Tax=Streptomonospora wellingtoniae TaxID=3075544 RepID=A0ABU2KRP4_9ACTN|nr:hypothetical protein [Streptomonospora sp. DSM 45055]MDT0301956.1 hypothetical protein [Streptomonospora sp. DSM 45055]